VHANATAREWQRDAPGPDPKFERRALAGKPAMKSTTGSTTAGSNMAADESSYRAATSSPK
jgi:hypothetical protein